MLMLDMILLCLGLDIPLKQMQEYMDGENRLDIKELLKDGRRAVRVTTNISGREWSLQCHGFTRPRMIKPT